MKKFLKIVKIWKYLQNSDIFINSSTPSFNLPIMNLALKYNTNYADLASDIYKDEIISTLKFDQQILENEFKSQNLFCFNKSWDSPGITNF